MPYNLPPTNLTNGTTGLENLLIWEAGEVSYFATGWLVLIFFVIFLIGYTNQRKRNGYASFPLWSATALLITTFLAFVLFLYRGIVTLDVIVILVVLTITFSAWALLNKEE